MDRSRRRGATAARCCCPPESCSGRCFAPGTQVDQFQRFPDEVASLSLRNALIEQGQLDVRVNVEFVDEIEALEDEPDLALA